MLRSALTGLFVLAIVSTGSAQTPELSVCARPPACPADRCELVINVHLKQQRVCVFRNGKLKANLIASTGRSPYFTPPGFYPVQSIRSEFVRRERRDDLMADYRSFPRGPLLLFKGGLGITTAHGLQRSKLGRPSTHGSIVVRHQDMVDLHREVLDAGREQTSVIIQ